MSGLYEVFRDNTERYYRHLSMNGQTRDDVAGDLSLMAFIRDILECHGLSEEQVRLLMTAFEEIVAGDRFLRK
jgi:hypothetical protein